MKHLILYLSFPVSAFCQKQDASDFSETHLNLSNRGLKEIPADIMKYGNLRELDLSYNYLTEVKAPQAMPQVVSIVLDHNPGINPGVLDDLSQSFPNLEHISLRSCGIPLLIYSGVTNDRLLSIDLADNELPDIPASLQDFPSIVSLDLSYNRLGESKYVLSTLRKLQELNISGNKQAGLVSILQMLETTYTLRSLTLGATNSKRVWRMISALPLKTLEIHGAAEFPSGMSSCTSLERLCFSESQVQEIPESVRELKNLKELVIDRSEIPSRIDRFPRLENLIIEERAFGLEAHARELKKLNKLNLTGVDISPQAVESLVKQLPNVEIQSELPTGDYTFAPTEKTRGIPVRKNTFLASEQQTVQQDFVSLAIPASAFLDASGNVYNGPVITELKTYPSVIDIFLDNTSMTVDFEGKQELFSSAGMFAFTATTPTGEKLQPNPVNPIQVNMTDLQPGTAPALWEYDSTATNWKQLQAVAPAIDNTKLLKRIADSINRLTFSDAVSVVSIPPFYGFSRKASRFDKFQLHLTTPSRPRKQLVKINPSYFIFYPRQYESNLIGRQSWSVDTIVSPALRDSLKCLALNTKLKKNKMGQYYNRYRAVKDVHLVTDLANDNYRLLFTLADSTVSIPVHLVDAGSSRKAARNNQRFAQKLKMARNKDEAEQRRIKSVKASNQKKAVEYVKLIRIAQEQQLALQLQSPAASFSFQLRGFGLINCDYFYKANKPKDYLALKSYDARDGEKVAIPEAVQICFENRKVSYTGYSSRIPLYRNEKTFVIFKTDDKLYVTTITGSLKSPGITQKTILTKGRSYNEIHDEILH